MPNLDVTPSTEQVEARLREAPIVWLASTRPDGRPHLVPVWFFWDGATVLILSQPDNQKVRNIRHNPRVMLAIDDSHEGHDVVLLEGDAELVAEPAAAVTPPAYGEKYARLLAEMNWRTDDMIAAYRQAIRVRPVRFITW